MRFLPVAMFLGTFARSFVHGPWDVTVTLRWTGWILGISTLVTVATAPVRGRWAERGNPEEMYVGVEAAQGIAFLAPGAPAPLDSVWPYGTTSFVRKLCIAPDFPIVVARLAQHAGGQLIGVINSAGIGAAFVGPVARTTLLTRTSPVVLYAALALIGLAFLPAVTAQNGASRGHA